MTPLRLALLVAFSLSALQPFIPSLRAAGKLKDEASAYLRSHDADVIDWMPWSDAVATRAKTENKPVYVFIGYFTSELTRAMHKQSFTNPQVAEAMNRDFICVLVDRDERPDLAALHESYLQSAKQLNGWPANVWLTSELKPFDGATYLPPSEEWGKEGVSNALTRTLAAWKGPRETLKQKADEAVSTTIAGDAIDLGPTFSPEKVQEQLHKATASWLEHYDTAHGGFGDAPRFLEPELLRFLLRTAGPGRDAALATLRALDRSPMHDPLDGGFFHRSVDSAWEFPSFQKILGDQARLALAYLEAAEITKDATLAETARAALDYALSRLGNSTGGCIHAEDATPEGIVYGFGWTHAELVEALGRKDADDFAAAYGAKSEGNVSADNDPGAKWKGKNLLYRVSSASEPAREKQFAAARAKLLALRDGRAAALRDENRLIGENALLAVALARAGQQLKDTKYIEAAKHIADFVEKQGRDAKTGGVLRLAGSAASGAADDHAFVALCHAALNTASPDAKHLTMAKDQLKTQTAAFLDEKTGHFFAQAASAPAFWMRPHQLDPSAGDLPSAEMATLLAYAALNTPVAEIPPSLLRGLTASLNDPTGQPRGDVLLAATLIGK